MKIVALAGGVGGAKLAYGLQHQLAAGELTVIVNTADDFTHLALHISPDIDTLCYTLADLSNFNTGWGRKDESWHVLEELSILGAPDWFRLGDRDLATHIERTRRMAEGQRLSQITRDFCKSWGIQALVLPMSDDPVATIVNTDQGKLSFQEYFVARACEPKVKDFEFRGIGAAKAAPGVLEAIDEADLVIICPSNPWVSIDPILGIKDIRAGINAKKVIALSPLIGGKAVKGPAAKMYKELGIEPSSENIARHYGQLLNALILDFVDEGQKTGIESMGIMTLATHTLMKTLEDRRRLASEILAFAEKHLL